MKKILLSMLLSLALIFSAVGLATIHTAAASDQEVKEYTFANMTYEIPVDWKEKGNNTELNHYYYSDTSMIMVNNGSTTSGKTVLNETDQDIYLKALEQSFDKFEVIEKNTYTVGPYTGFSFKANMTTNSTDSLMYAIVFDNAKQLRAFTINSFNGADDSAILDDVAASVKFDDSESTNTETTETQTKGSSGGTTENKANGSGGTNEITEFNQETAVERAKFHTKYNSYSQKGLVKMLVFEGFSDEDAEYGAANCGADWNKEAMEDAESYLNYKSYTRQELYDQLKYEGYTEGQILYALAKVGL